MRSNWLGSAVGAVCIAVGFFFIGLWAGHSSNHPFKKPPPADGNPIGFRLHGLVTVEPKSFDINACAKGCTLDYNVVTDKSNKPPKKQPCEKGAANCLYFYGMKMTEWSEDDYGPKPEDAGNIAGDGTIHINP